MADLEERLRSHAQAFDGLLSLIPAKIYYGEDGSDQWKRKKQTKEQAREAKRAKLDPDSAKTAKTAKDVMDEKARKRKRGEQNDDEDQEDGDSSDDAELGSELPKEGLNRGDASKKQKQADKPADPEADAKKAEARKLKEEKKQQKKQEQKEKKKAKDTAKKAKLQEKQEEETQKADASKDKSKPAPKSEEPTAAAEDDDEVNGEENPVAEGFSLEFSEDNNSTSTALNSPDFDTSNPQSGSSSISSIVPPSDNKTSSEPKAPKPSQEELKSRLQKRLDELRAARQADGLNGKPARNRQELIEARRQKAEQRKAHKKELRQKAREEEQRQKDEAMTRRFSPGGSGSLLASPRSPADSVGSGNYAFGRVVFADGQVADPSLTNVREKPKATGPGLRDAAAALKAAEAKKTRLAGLDEEKRADIEEKDMWLNAKKRAHGERVRDDTSLLKKALKRKESAKKRSEREWKDRIDTVKRGKDLKQKTREENLRKRREGKGQSGGGKKASGAGKGKPRPGFEGSFKAKVGGGGGKKK
ncbi:surfeit locus protein 6-domain-containing protein [Aspergillus venezuelensis]